MRFRSNRHRDVFYDIVGKMKNDDCYHQALAYLISLDSVCREHIESLFDFDHDIILFDALKEGWQTGTSVKTTRLAFNLWSGYVDETPVYSTPSELFCCEYAVYYVEAIKLRYPDFMCKLDD